MGKKKKKIEGEKKKGVKNKKIEGGKKKVSKKKKAIQAYKWIKHFYAELDEVKARLDLIERFLGAPESMRKVLENGQKH